MWDTNNLRSMNDALVRREAAKREELLLQLRVRLPSHLYLPIARELRGDHVDRSPPRRLYVPE